ncbi:MAG: hypothetical protein QY331_09090 [Melioribacteraceae bacterium]|nr:MAG: hypothetical protein QY331_09090 [Melioribacteraceae bacterium]
MGKKKQQSKRTKNETDIEPSMKLEGLRSRVKKFNTIIRKSNERFDKLVSTAGFDNISWADQEDYERFRDGFTYHIVNHFKTNKIIKEKFTIVRNTGGAVIPEPISLPLSGELKKAKVANDIDNISDERIDEVIENYAEAAIAFYGLALKLNNQILSSGMENIVNKLLKYSRASANTRPEWTIQDETKIFNEAEELYHKKNDGLVTYPRRNALFEASKSNNWLIPQKYLDKKIYNKDAELKNINKKLVDRFHKRFSEDITIKGTK